MTARIYNEVVSSIRDVLVEGQAKAQLTTEIVVHPVPMQDVGTFVSW